MLAKSYCSLMQGHKCCHVQLCTWQSLWWEEARMYNQAPAEADRVSLPWQSQFKPGTVLGGLSRAYVAGSQVIHPLT